MNLVDERLHPLRHCGVGTANRVPFDVLRLHSGTIDLRNDLMNLHNVGDDLELGV